MNWFWLNIPVGAVFFFGMAGIRPWIVVRHPAVPAGICGRRELACATAGDCD